MAEREYTISIRIGAVGEAAEKALGLVGNSLDKLKDAAVGLAIGAGVALVGVGASIAKLALDAAPIEGIRLSFENMATSFGINGQKLMEAMRQASAGMVRDSDLMLAANKALTGAGEQLGQEFGDKLPRLLEVARAAARATGQDATFLFESLVTGIKRTSPMLIDNTGLQLKLGEANQALADQLGKTVEELTGEERQLALLNATVAAGDILIGKMGATNLTVAEQMAQMRTASQNLKDQIGEAFLPVLKELLDIFTDLGGKSGPMLSEWAKRFSDFLVSDVIPRLKELAVWFRDNIIPLALELASFVKDSLVPGLMGLAASIIDGVVPPLKELAVWFREHIVPAMEKLAAFIADSLVPGLLELVSRFRENVIPSAQEVSGFVATTLIPTLQRLAQFVIEEVIPRLNELAIWFREHVVPAVFDLVAAVQEHLIPPLQRLVENIVTNLLPVLGEIVKAFLEQVVPVIMDVVLPALAALWDIFVEKVIPAFGGLLDLLSPLVSFFATLAEWFGKLQQLSREWGEGLHGLLELIRGLLDLIGRIPGNIGDIIGRLPGIAGPEMPVLIGAPERRGVPMGIPEAVPGRERAEPGGGMRAAGHTFNINVTGTGDAAQDVERVVRTMELLYRVS